MTVLTAPVQIYAGDDLSLPIVIRAGNQPYGLAGLRFRAPVRAGGRDVAAATVAVLDAAGGSIIVSVNRTVTAALAAAVSPAIWVRATDADNRVTTLFEVPITVRT